MARIIGLDFVGEWLLGVELVGSGSRPLVGATLAAKLPAELTTENAAELGDWLRQQFSQQGFSATEVACTLERSQVTLKTLRVPDCPDGELPALLAYAAGDDGGLFQEETILDFQAGPVNEGQRESLCAIVSTEIVNAVEQMIAKSGYTLSRLGLRPFATHFGWTRLATQKSSGRVFLVAPSIDGLELSIWNDDRLLFCRSVQVTSEEEIGARVSVEVRRTLAAFQASESGSDIDLVGLCTFPDSPSRLADSLKDLTGRPIQEFDLGQVEGLDQAVPASHFAAAVGTALRESSQAGWPIDFLQPKKAVLQSDHRKTVLALAGVLAVMVLIGAYSYAHRIRSVQDQKIEKYTSDLAGLDLQLKNADPMLRKHHAIEEWVNGEIHVLAELQELSATFPDTSQAFLEVLELSAGKPDGLATINLHGRARKSEIVTKAQTEWSKSKDNPGHYQVVPGKIDSKPGSSEFAYGFDLELRVRPFSARECLERKDVWMQHREMLEPEEGMERVTESFEHSKYSRRVTKDRRSGTPNGSDDIEKESSETEFSSLSTPGSSEELTSDRSPRNSAAEDESESQSTDPVTRLVEKIKGLPFEEKQKEIQKIPAFLRNRVLQKLEESSR